MRLGRVGVTHSYVVDLDNPNMIEDAKIAIYEDIMNNVKFDELQYCIDVLEEEKEELKIEDIQEFLYDSYNEKE